MNRRVILAVVLLVLFLINVSSVLAFVGDYDPKNPVTWDQNTCEGADLPTGLPGYSFEPPATFGSYGCALHSVVAAMVKYGARDRGYIPLDYRKECLGFLEENGLTEHVSCGMDAAGNTNFWGAAEMSNGVFGNVEYSDTPGSADLFRQGIKAGKFYIIQLYYNTNHFVLLDGVRDDGGLLIYDPGYRDRTLMSQYPGGEEVMTGYVSFELFKNRGAPSLYEDSGDSWVGDSVDDSGVVVGSDSGGSLVSDLVGLETQKRKVIEAQQGINTAYVQSIPDLQTRDLFEKLGEDIGITGAARVDKLSRALNVVVSLLGLVLVLFGVLRLVAWYGDVYLNLGLFSFFSGGSGVVASDDDSLLKKGESEGNDLDKQRVVGVHEVWWGSLGIVFVGVFLLSGLFIKVLVALIGLVGGIFR